MNYGNILKELRNENNLTQEDVANILNIIRVQYNQYENEYVIIPIKYLNALANYYNVSLDYLFNFTTDKYKIKVLELDSKIVGNRLKEIRRENNLTGSKLAKILNTNQSVIANYERGRTIIATPFLYQICNKYKVSADYLLGKIDSPKYLK